MLSILNCIEVILNTAQNSHQVLTGHDWNLLLVRARLKIEVFKTSNKI